MFDPYKVLGLKTAKATPEQITKAFRRKSMQTHPDRQGNAADFAAVKLAYSVLGDPAKKAEYDRTGKMPDDKPSREVEKVATVLNQAFCAVMTELAKHGVKVAEKDLVAEMRQCIGEAIKQMEKNEREHGKALAQLQDCQGRFTVKGEDNLMDGILRQQIDAVTRMGDNIRTCIADHKQALEALKGFTFRHEAKVEEWTMPSMRGYIRMTTV